MPNLLTQGLSIGTQGPVKGQPLYRPPGGGSRLIPGGSGLGGVKDPTGQNFGYKPPAADPNSGFNVSGMNQFTMGTRAAAPTDNIPNPINKISQKQKSTQQPKATTPVASPANTAVGGSPSVVTGTFLPGSPQNAGPSPAPAQTQAPTPSPYSLPSLLGGLASGVTPGSQMAQTGFDRAQQYQQELEQSQENEAKALGAIGNSPIPLEFQQGRAAVLQGQYQGQQAALGSALQGESNLAGLGVTSQGQQLGALGTAANVARPEVAQYGQTAFNPVTGQFGAGGSATGDFSSALSTYAQGMANNSINPSQIPSSVSNNPVLMAQLIQQAQQINPNFSPTQWQANTQAQQTNLQQTSQQAQQTQQAVTYASSLLDDLTQAYGNLSGAQTTPIPAVNYFANLFSNITGAGISATTAYGQATQEARAAVTQALSSSGQIGVDQAGQIANSLIPQNATPQQIQTAKQYLQRFMQQRQETYTTPPPAAQYGGGGAPAGGGTGGNSLYNF